MPPPPPPDAAGTVTASDGVRLAYARWAGPSGAAAAPTVVLLHGWSGSRRYWEPCLAGLCAAAPVVAVDLRFHGRSGPARTDPAGGAPAGAHVARLAVDLDNVLAALGLSDVVTVGASMGAAVLWCYAELFGGGRVRSMVFVDQAPLQNRAPGWTLGSLGCYDDATLAGLQTAVRGDAAAFASGNAAACLATGVDADTAALLAAETALADRDALAALMADHTRLDWRPQVKALPVPCLVVCGGASAIFPPAGCRWVAEHAPRAQVRVFEGCGHWLYVERPAEFAAVVAKFVCK